MAQFDESKVITPLHPEKAEVGKKYWHSDSLLNLKDYVESESGIVGYLDKVNLDNKDSFPFYIAGNGDWQFLYEVPPEKRMTNAQLMEWLAKGNGFYKDRSGFVHFIYAEKEERLNEEVNKTFCIRPFGHTAWVEPTVDIYIRDCKKR